MRKSYSELGEALGQSGLTQCLNVSNFVAHAVVEFCPDRRSHDSMFTVVRGDGVAFKVKIRVEPALK